MKATALIKKLQKLVKKHGDKDVAYVSSYEWADEFSTVTIEPGDSWDGAPKKDFIALE